MVNPSPSLAAPSAKVESQTPTALQEVDAALFELADKAREFARLPPITKAALLRECIPRVLEIAAEWVRHGCLAKGLRPAEAGEEWLAGPLPTVRNLRLLADSLDAIDARGRPSLGRGSRIGDDGRLRVELLPSSRLDSVLLPGFTGYALMEEGLSRESAAERQAEFFHRRSPEGGISLILGAGNVSSIPPMDAFTKMFVEGYVCALKVNPVNEWIGPILERALAPLVSRGYLRIIYGGAAVGKHLVDSELVADIHITGSDKTHDLIVWGPPGTDRDRRKAEKRPLLSKPISSELGNVSPVAVVPYSYSESELAFQARNVVAMVANNASFNCNAAKLLITSRGWSQREQFMALIERALRDVPTRKAYYPGAFDRYRSLTDGRENVVTIGESTDSELAWTILRGIDAADSSDPVFDTEPFCGILSETSVGSDDPAQFLSEVTEFLNERVWGTLNACIIIHPRLERDPIVGKALERAIVELRYGTVAINHWPAIGYGSTVMPWGGHQSATLGDIQSGIGWVHNTYLLGGIDKSVIRGPLKVWPEPLWFAGNAAATKLGPDLVAMEARPSWFQVPRLVLGVLRG